MGSAAESTGSDTAPNRSASAEPPPPNPPMAVTPAWVADTEAAVTEPFDPLVPCTVTVSPGLRAERDDLAFRSTVVVDPTSTATRLPVEVVTYKVLPMMSVTVPARMSDEAAEGVDPPAPAARNLPASEEKAEARCG